MMINNIIKYIDTGNKVYLFSFCKVEGDEESILRIKELLPNNPCQLMNERLSILL